MKKVIPEKIITSCMECHWLVVPDRDNPYERSCFGGSASRKVDIDYYTTILSWCPLPDYKGWQDKPKIVCLCGSTKFREAYEQANLIETLAGNIVLSVGCFMHYDRIPITNEQKFLLDELHLRKIDLADEVLILNVGDYVGESTANEIKYAQEHGKPIRYLVAMPPEEHL